MNLRVHFDIEFYVILFTKVLPYLLDESLIQIKL